MEYLLIATIFFPIFAGLSLLFLKEEELYSTAMVVTALTALLSISVLVTGVEFVSLPLFSPTGLTLNATTFGRIYGVITPLLWLVGVGMSRDALKPNDRHQTRLYSSLLITLGATLGVFYAGDLLTLLVFFEVMSLTSCLWVAHNQDGASALASASYLAFSVLGGLSMLFGLFLLYGLYPSLEIATLTTYFAPHVGEFQHTAACLFLFLGFGIKAGTFFLYDWLPVSYMAAPTPATALLSGLLSKTGLYGILLIVLRIASGSQNIALFVLLLALLNMVVGGLFALFSDDMKGTLAYSSISQIGFILWGIALTALLGEHGAIAAYGTLFHMINHSVIKVLLFSLAGVVHTTTGTLNLNQIQGFGRGKPWFHATFIIGAGSMAGLPLLSGYVSKTLLHEAMTEYIALEQASLLFSMAEGVFLFAGGCTLAYMLKLYFCLFHEGAPTPSVSQPSYPVQTGLSLLAGVLVVLGVTPHLSFQLLGDFSANFLGVHQLEGMVYFSLTNLTGAAISILIGLFLFWCLRSYARLRWNPIYSGSSHRLPTVEQRIYRPGIALLSFVGGFVARIFDLSTDGVVAIFRMVFFTPLSIPKTFYEGDPTYGHHQRTRIHITFSLAYSLLMFGMGFLFTIAVLLFLGGRS